ncbi:MAG: hypothetical protein WBY28_08535 [Nitrososphaeraceae archaeon]
MQSIGFAQMEKKILQAATDIKEPMSQETKVEDSYSTDEIKVYVHKMIEELKTLRPLSCNPSTCTKYTGDIDLRSAF